MTAPTILPDIHRARFCAERIVHDASAALAVRDLGPTAHATYLRNARKNLDDLADSFGLELVDPDAEDAVTLRDAVQAWRGYANASADHGMTFAQTQDAFKGPFPRHHALMFGKACDAPALALAGE